MCVCCLRPCVACKRLQADEERRLRIQTVAELAAVRAEHMRSNDALASAQSSLQSTCVCVCVCVCMCVYSCGGLSLCMCADYSRILFECVGCCFAVAVVTTGFVVLLWEWFLHLPFLTYFRPAALRDEGVHTQRAAASQSERLSQQLSSLWQECQSANEQLVSLQRETETLKSTLVQQRSEGTRYASYTYIYCSSVLV